MPITEPNLTLATALRAAYNLTRPEFRHNDEAPGNWLKDIRPVLAKGDETQDKPTQDAWRNIVCPVLEDFDSFFGEKTKDEKRDEDWERLRSKFKLLVRMVENPQKEKSEQLSITPQLSDNEHMGDVEVNQNKQASDETVLTSALKTVIGLSGHDQQVIVERLLKEFQGEYGKEMQGGNDGTLPNTRGLAADDGLKPREIFVKTFAGTIEGAAHGTPHYMPPEQAEGQVEWLETLEGEADAESAHALYVEADRFLHGRVGYIQDLDKGFSLYQQAAELGHVGSKFSLAVCFLYGYGVGRDFDKARELLEELSSKDLYGARLLCALLDEGQLAGGTGREAAQERCKAVYPHLLSNDNLISNPAAIFFAGCCNFFFLGRAYDPQAALAFFTIFRTLTPHTELPDSLSDYAAVYCGIIHLFGCGVSKNEELALKEFQAASDRGFVAGTRNVAYCLEHGVGCDANPDKAKKLLEKTGKKTWITIQPPYEFDLDLNSNEMDVRCAYDLYTLKRWREHVIRGISSLDSKTVIQKLRKSNDNLKIRFMLFDTDISDEFVLQLATSGIEDLGAPGPRSLLSGNTYFCASQLDLTNAVVSRHNQRLTDLDPWMAWLAHLGPEEKQFLERLCTERQLDLYDFLREKFDHNAHDLSKESLSVKKAEEHKTAPQAPEDYLKAFDEIVSVGLKDPESAVTLLNAHLSFVAGHNPGDYLVKKARVDNPTKDKAQKSAVYAAKEESYQVKRLFVIQLNRLKSEASLGVTYTFEGKKVTSIAAQRTQRGSGQIRLFFADNRSHAETKIPNLSAEKQQFPLKL